LLCFIFGIGIILGIRLACEHFINNKGEIKQIAIAVSVGKSGAFLISIGTLLGIIYFFGLSQSAYTITPNLFITWSDPAIWREAYTFDDFLRTIPFFFAIVFMMAIDIAGSPVDYLQFLKSESKAYNNITIDEPTTIRRSFLVDSVSNIAVAMSGITPVVYYAENHVGWQAGGRTGRTAAVVGACFFVCGLIGVIFWYLQTPISEFISRFAAMPALFFVGAWLVADAFANPTSLGSFSQFSGDNPDREHLTDGTVSGSVAPTPTNEGRVLNFLPAALTTVLATITTLDNAIAAGILADALAYLFPERYRGARRPPRWELIMVYFGAAFIILWSLRVKFLSL
jgi:hypothetical protein